MSQLFYELPAEDKQKVLARLKENPPYIYEQPDLDPDGEVTPRFLDDLTTLAALRPLHQPLEELVSETAAYLRQNPSRVQKQLDQKLIAHLSSKLGEDAPRPRFPGPVAQAALAMLEGDEWPLFVYSHVTFEWTPGVRRTPFPKNSLWLYGTDRRLLVLAHEDGVRPVWQADETVSCEPVRGMFVTDARLDGGRWLPDEDRRVPAVRIAGSVTKGYEAYFAPLLEKVDSKPPKRVS